MNNEEIRKAYEKTIVSDFKREQKEKIKQERNKDVMRNFGNLIPTLAYASVVGTILGYIFVAWLVIKIIQFLAPIFSAFI